MRDDLDDDSDDLGAGPAPPSDPAAERRTAVARALKRYVQRLTRKLEGLQGDLAEAEAAAKWRRCGEALLAYAKQVPARAASVTLPDPADATRTLEIALDPNVAPPANAARYFKRAAKGERGARDIPPRIAAVEVEREALRGKLQRLTEAADPEIREAAEVELERVLLLLGTTVREQIGAPESLSRRELALPASGSAARAASAPARPAARRGELPAKLTPWRFRTSEGWDVLIGRTSEGNDYLSTRLARPEDYWFHVHGSPGSHVVLRRGKGPNEPSKATLEEVASWAAFHSKARTAGKVPVHWTLAKYVRKPRGAKPGLVTIEREKAIMVRPVEPPKERMADALGDEASDGGA
jgi:predicted ribosome quality control (RQC) complex YloA/Tae2 family protein